jgi:hypothetical protein
MVQCMRKAYLLVMQSGASGRRGNPAQVPGRVHQKHHVEEIYTPPDENGKMERTILPVAGGPATRMGRESACRSGPLGPIFLQAAEGQGAVACPDWYSGFLFSWEVTMSQDVLASFVR